MKGTKMTKRALISVSDKAGIVGLAQELPVPILGYYPGQVGQRLPLIMLGWITIAIDDVTGFPEMMTAVSGPFIQISMVGSVVIWINTLKQPSDNRSGFNKRDSRWSTPSSPKTRCDLR